MDRRIDPLRRPLTDAEILAIIDSWDNSDVEDEGCDDDNYGDEEQDMEIERILVTNTDDIQEDVVEFEQNEIEQHAEPDLFNILELPIDIILDNGQQFQPMITDDLQEINAEINNDQQQLRPTPPDYKTLCSRLIWRQRDFEIDEEKIAFSGSTGLTSELKDLDTPFKCFKYLFDDDLMHHIVDESNKYSAQTNINNPKCITFTELQKFIGICIVMSVVQIPESRKYWNPVAGNKLVQDTMTLNNFEKIKKILHYNDNGHVLSPNDPHRNRIYKIRQIFEKLIHNFQKVHFEQCLSVDEQLCSTKAKSYLKQYIPNKPHKWGYKLYVLAGVSGYTYNFEMYTRHNAAKRLPDEPDLGSSSNTVIRLLRELPKFQNYKVYFDNFYTSIPLVLELSNKGILCLGTIRRNSIPNCKLPNEKDFRKQQRGSSVEYVTTIQETTMTNVSWLDSKPVNLVSNFVGRLPIQASTRYTKKDGSITVDCPKIIKEYNQFMGGVDLFDSLIGRYKIKLRSKKWYHRIFFHLLDMSIVNSWILYKRIQSNSPSSSGNKLMSLAEFRLHIGEILCKSGKDLIGPGRPSEVNKALDLKRKKAMSGHIPPKEIRIDSVNHWPIWNAKRLHCKLPGCKGFTFIKCSKCETALCLNKDRNCFHDFHK